MQEVQKGVVVQVSVDAEEHVMYETIQRNGLLYFFFQTRCQPTAKTDDTVIYCVLMLKLRGAGTLFDALKDHMLY